MLTVEHDCTAIPESVYGLWQRESITLDDGTVDDTTRVYWAQTSSFFVDIRIPAGRPHCTEEELATLPDATLQQLAEQKGFAGGIVCEGGLFTWHRTIDFRPPNGMPDRALVCVDGDVLTEDGDPQSILGIGYREIYQRLGSGRRRRVALRLLACTGQPFGGKSARDAFLVVIDDYFLLARARMNALPQAEALGQLMRAAGRDSGKLSGLFDCEISLGRIESEACPWTITLSTHPWREGKSIFQTRAARVSGGNLILNHGPQGETSVWTIHDCSLQQNQLEDVFSVSKRKLGGEV